MDLLTELQPFSPGRLALALVEAEQRFGFQEQGGGSVHQIQGFGCLGGSASLPSPDFRLISR